MGRHEAHGRGRPIWPAAGENCCTRGRHDPDGPRHLGEHGDAGGYAATGITSTSRSMSGYQRLKMALSSPFSVRTRVCNNKCAPSLDHCICCFLQKRLLTTSFTVDSLMPGHIL